MSERTIYLVRHGHCDHTLHPHNLSALGREQSLATAQWLRSQAITTIHSSTLHRAIQTAEIISREVPGVPVQATALLRELPNFLWEPKGLRHHSTHNIEESRTRAEEAFAMFCGHAAQESSIDVVVSHGNMIRYFVCRALGIAPESWWNLGTYNCGITQIRVLGDGRVRMFSYNDTTHLTAGLRSEGVMPMPAGASSASG